MIVGVLESRELPAKQIFKGNIAKNGSTGPSISRWCPLQNCAHQLLYSAPWLRSYITTRGCAQTLQARRVYDDAEMRTVAVQREQSPISLGRSSRRHRFPDLHSPLAPQIMSVSPSPHICLFLCKTPTKLNRFAVNRCWWNAHKWCCDRNCPLNQG